MYHKIRSSWKLSGAEAVFCTLIYVQLSKHALIQTFHGWQLCQKVVKTVRSDGTPSKAIPPLLNVHVYFAKACRCRVAIPQASKLAKTVASDGTPSKQPSSFRHVTSLDGRTYGYIYNINRINIYIYIHEQWVYRHEWLSMIPALQFRTNNTVFLKLLPKVIVFSVIFRSRFGEESVDLFNGPCSPRWVQQLPTFSRVLGLESRIYD